MRKRAGFMYSKRVGDPSSKYGLNPDQFEIDIMNKQRQTQELKKNPYMFKRNQRRIKNMY
ncbi:hypothetical protein [Bacillus glycinifermentans]|uniref:hypothetical protein n=1 Tax=Bacillus glycinifermentans TaxID=1664069 RepID=UPI000BC2C837|nr:hypothetical protein [Bacillus glycinifermentans]ATH91628.1 hypothetical protein COP00_02595 [Bacillus glycinifermentans]